MINHDLGVIVLAAGQGTRMRSALPKVLHELGGKPMLRRVLDVADALASTRTVVVLAEETLAPVQAALGDRYAYALQAERLGTGHAVLQARSLLAGQTQRVLVLYGDTPLLRPETVRTLAEEQGRTGTPVAMLSFIANPPTGYGRVLRNASGQVQGVVEERDATDQQRQINEVASGIFCFDADWLWATIDQLRPNPPKGEYYLTSLPELAVAQYGVGAVVALPITDPYEALGVNDRAQLAEAEAALRQRVLSRLFEAGVTIIDPATTYVEDQVSVGRDSVLLPGTILQGATSIGEHCTIGPSAQLINCQVGDGCRIWTAMLADMAVPSYTTIEPYTVERRAPVEAAPKPVP